MTAFASFENLLKAHSEMKKRFRLEATDLFKTITKEFFDENPGITAIHWTQYTPYFNDGDVCEFRVNEIHFTNCPIDSLDDINSWGEYEGDDDDVISVNSNIEYILDNAHSYYKKSKEGLNKLINEEKIDITSIKKFAEIVESPEMEDVMLELFGDHVSVTATRDGFSAEDLEHD